MSYIQRADALVLILPLRCAQGQNDKKRCFAQGQNDRERCFAHGQNNKEKYLA